MSARVEVEAVKKIREKISALRAAAVAVVTRARGRSVPRETVCSTASAERRALEARVLAGTPTPGDALIVHSGLYLSSLLTVPDYAPAAHVRLAFSSAADNLRCVTCASSLWTDHARGDVLRCLVCEPMGPALEYVRSKMDAAELRRLRGELRLWEAGR